MKNRQLKTLVGWGLGEGKITGHCQGIAIMNQPLLIQQQTGSVPALLPRLEILCNYRGHPAAKKLPHR